MKAQVGINVFLERGIAFALMIMLQAVSYTSFFHHHENAEQETLSGHHQERGKENCAICDFFIHKQSDTFLVTGEIRFQLIVSLVLILFFELLTRQAAVFRTRPSNKAPPLMLAKWKSINSLPFEIAEA
ncbi:MAG: hypothetical protein EOO20_17265 [Chryseobacterium sp.]|nr:MAG: hypothetical protein EOO20_17265 [Chryseobacterium sp.]